MRKTGFISALVHAAAWPFRVWRNRSEMHLLLRLNEHELRDIGLTSSDIMAVSSLPLDEDPTLVLAQRAKASRRRANL